jgi:hypothetical protein
MDYAFNHLSDVELIELSKTWLFDAGVRAAFERTALLAALLPELEGAHEGMLAAASPVATGLPDARELDEADAQHDRESRGALEMLSGLALLTGDPKVGAIISSLYPQGATIHTSSYIKEAGEGARIAANLTDEHRALLRKVVLHDGSTLLDHVMARLVHAAELGRLVEARAQANAQAQPAPRESTRAGARQRWITVARAIIQSLAVARVDEPDARSITAKLSALQR